jgi:hypothetical protein
MTSPLTIEKLSKQETERADVLMVLINLSGVEEEEEEEEEAAEKRE